MKNETTTAKLANMGVDVKITAQDVISIHVEKAEDLLTKHCESLETFQKGLKKLIVEKNKELTKEIEILIEACKEGILGRLIEALKYCNNMSVDENTKGLKADLMLHQTNIEKCEITAKIVVTGRNRYSQLKLAIVKLGQNVTVKNLMDLLNTKNDKLTEVSNQLTKARTRLANIGSLERKAKAAMSRQLLAESPDGKELLLTLDNLDIPELEYKPEA